jgi:hypothetical protein
MPPINPDIVRVEPTLAVLVPTAGRTSLARLLGSIARQQRVPGDEVLVLGDTLDGPLPHVERMASVVPGASYIEVNTGHHCYGHCQLTEGLKLAAADWLTFNDDDDVYLPGAFAVIRRAIRQQPYPRPLLFRFVSRLGVIFWFTPSLHEGNVGGHCLVVPNVHAKLGTWTCRYEGDYDFVEETVKRWGGDVEWREEIIARARPGGA